MIQKSPMPHWYLRRIVEVATDFETAIANHIRRSTRYALPHASEGVIDDSHMAPINEIEPKPSMHLVNCSCSTYARVGGGSFPQIHGLNWEQDKKVGPTMRSMTRSPEEQYPLTAVDFSRSCVANQCSLSAQAIRSARKC